MTKEYNNYFNDGKHIILKPYSQYNNTGRHIFIRNGMTYIDGSDGVDGKVINEGVETLTTTPPESKSKYPKHWKKFADEGGEGGDGDTEC